MVYTGKMTDQLDEDRAARNLQRFLNAAVTEMEMVAVSLGRTALADISKSDLCALDPVLARATGVQLGLVPPDRQERLFPELAGRWQPGWLPPAEPPGGSLPERQDPLEPVH